MYGVITGWESEVPDPEVVDARVVHSALAKVRLDDGHDEVVRLGGLDGDFAAAHAGALSHAELRRRHDDSRVDGRGAAQLHLAVGVGDAAVVQGPCGVTGAEN